MQFHRGTLTTVLTLLALLIAPVATAFAQPRNPLQPRTPPAPRGPEREDDDRARAIADLDHRIEVIERRLSEVHVYVDELHEAGAHEEAEEFQIVADALALALDTMRDKRGKLERGEGYEFWLELYVDPARQARVDELRRKADDLRRRIDEAYSVRDAQLALELERKLEDVERQLVEAEAQLHEHDGGAFFTTPLNHEMVELQTAIARIDVEIAQLEAKLLRARMSDDVDQNAIRKMMIDVEELTAKRAAMQAELEELRSATSEATPFGMRLNDEQLRLRDELAKLESRMADLESAAKLATREGRIEEARKLLSELEELRLHQDELARALERAFGESRFVRPDDGAPPRYGPHGSDALRAEIDDVRARLAEAHAMLDRIAADMEEARARGDMDAVRRGEVEFERAAVEAKNLQAHLDKLQAALESADRVGPDGRAPHADRDERVDHLRAQIAELQAELDELMLAWAQAKERGDQDAIEGLATRSMEMLRRIDELQAELDRLVGERDRRGR